jgi:8-oxo-dGTP pyrophosphatase MutT (NUDIX family)
MCVSDDLAAHVPADAFEAADLERIRAFVAAHDRPFDRETLEGHLTASAVIVAANGSRVLLVHHRRLDRWLQPGGHGELGEVEGWLVALREALEETGVVGLVRHAARPSLLDVDVHRIPARGDVLAHDHLDLRYLFTAPPDATLQRCAEETRDARWFTWEELATVDLDPAARRMFGKAQAIVEDGRAR